MYQWNKSDYLTLSTINTLFLLVGVGLHTGCSTVPFRERADSLFLITENVNVYYDLKDPKEKFYLPYVLAEISGIAYSDDQRLLCVEDEGGRVYEYDLESRTILNAITFSTPGDFEGVELIGDTIYVLQSNGDLYQFAYTNEDNAPARKIGSKLSSKNNTEGLGYNPYSGHLMIACKEEEDIKGVHAKGKAVYAFDPVSKKLISEPLFEISPSKMKTFFEANREFEYEKDRIKFEPSGIAYNPLDGYFYLLASVGKLLVVLDKEGEIRATYPIAPRVLNQPEGIAFAPNGDLYISSEGEGDKGYIMKFTPKER